MARRWQAVLALTVVAMVAAAPLVYSSYRSVRYRNFRVMEEGKLYRSGQMTPAGLEQVLHDCRIKTLITLRTSRDSGKLPPDTWEEEMCAAHDVRHVRIVPRLWGADETGEVPAEQAVKEFLDVMDKPENYPVLVHCFAGIHRTGTMCAIYRMEYDRWPIDRASVEMQQCGFDPDKDDGTRALDEFLRNYTPRWKRMTK